MTSVKVPSMGGVSRLGKEAIIAGGIGGIGRAMGGMFMGPLGAALGSVIAGAAVGGIPGTVIAVSGVSDGMALATAGLVGRFMPGAGTFGLSAGTSLGQTTM